MVKHAHSQWFNVLSELGIVGLVLLAAALVLFVAAAVGNPFARRDDPLHPLLVALQVGAVAFLVHMSWDWDWDMAAAGTLAFVFLAAAASYRATRAADDRRAARSAARHAPNRSPSPAGDLPVGDEVSADRARDDFAGGRDDGPRRLGAGDDRGRRRQLRRAASRGPGRRGGGGGLTLRDGRRLRVHDRGGRGPGGPEAPSPPAPSQGRVGRARGRERRAPAAGGVLDAAVPCAAGGERRPRRRERRQGASRPWCTRVAPRGSILWR